MSGTGSPVNILLVDDQPAKLLSYEVILEELGETLIKASSGREALEALLRHETAVVLIDVSMPEIDGFELAEMIREHPRFRQTAIIFVSAIHLSDPDRLRGYAAGAVDYLPVPVVPDLLRAKVRVFVDLYRKTRQLETLNAELEQRVAQRTAELELANTELELRVEARTREREAALARIAEMQKMESLGQLTGGVAHDFNNLLMVVQSSAQLVRKYVGGDPQALRLLDLAAQAAERGATLVKRMLAFARRQDLQPGAVDLAEAVENMVEMMRHSLGPSVRIAVDFGGDLPPVRIDRNQLELALLNLGLNARDAMPSGGTLSIAARAADHLALPGGLAPGPYIQLSVADSGVGMDAETLKRASEPFFTTKGVGKGSGLGLSMVHGLVLQSEGAMQIASQPDEGTTVTLWLPVASASAASGSGASADKQPPETAANSRKLQVLLVDDDPLILTATAEMLRELGYAVIEAASAANALEALRGEAAVDLVITDHAMPDMTGAVLAEEIRGSWPAIPVLLSTGYADLPADMSVGAGRLQKPFSMQDLERTISRVVSAANSLKVPDLPLR